MASTPKLTAEETALLRACVGALPKGIPVGKSWKKVARSLVRKKLAWTMESIFMVCLATDAGRDLIEAKTGERS